MCVMSNRKVSCAGSPHGNGGATPGRPGEVPAAPSGRGRLLPLRRVSRAARAGSRTRALSSVTGFHKRLPDRPAAVLYHVEGGPEIRKARHRYPEPPPLQMRHWQSPGAGTSAQAVAIPLPRRWAFLAFLGPFCPHGVRYTVYVAAQGSMMLRQRWSPLESRRDYVAEFT